MGWKEASRRIQGIITSGRPYAQKIASLNLPDVFVYWHPETLKYAVAIPYGNVMEKRAQCESEFSKVGIDPVYSLAACEDTGWVPLRWPQGYSPLRRISKYASVKSTPAQLSAAGGLIGGTTGLLASLWWNADNEKLPFSEKLKNALSPAAFGTLIGTVPGVLQAVHHSMETRPWLEDGTFGRPDVGPFRAFIMDEDDLIKNSPVYRAKKVDNIVQEDAYGQKGVKKKAMVKPGAAFRGLDTSGPSMIHVDNFNRVVWDDTKNGFTQPENALLVTSALNASRPCGTSLVTPGAVIGTLVNAGVGFATAGVIGKTLGAMGMLSQPAQQKLREIGTWGGMINGIGQAMIH